MSTEKNSAAVREARRRLFAKLRNDFTFEWPARLPNDDITAGSRDTPSCDYEDARSLAVASTRSNRLEEVWSSALDWRERTYASSDPSSESGEDDDDDDDEDDKSEDDVAVDQSTTTRQGKSRRSPSAMSIDPKPLRDGHKTYVRKRRRQQRIDTEMQWNKGLAHWVMQRDAWCCARLQRSTVSQPSKTSAAAGPQSPPTQPREAAEPTAEEITDVKSWPSTDGSSSRADDEQPSNTERWSAPSAPPSSVTSASQQSVDNLPEPRTERAPTFTTLLPIPPPLLPADDPTRASITPNIYPSIYSKIVTQALTPSVPINLSHMVSALVQGWKTEGEWPPKEKVGIDSKGRPVIVQSNESGLVRVADSILGRSRTVGTAGGGRRKLLERRRGGGGNGGEKRLSLGSAGHHWGKIWKEKLSGTHSPPREGSHSPGPKEIGSHIFGSSQRHQASAEPSAPSPTEPHLVASPRAAEHAHEGPGFRKNVAAKVGRVLRLSIGGSEKMSTDSSPESVGGSTKTAKS